MHLHPGRHLYRFWIEGEELDSAAFLSDPENPARAESGYASDHSVIKAVNIIVDAVGRAEPEASAETRTELLRLLAEWERRALEAEQLGLKLRYQSRDNDHPALLRDFGERRDGWSTMHSMRSVDRQVRVIALGESL